MCEHEEAMPPRPPSSPPPGQEWTWHWMVRSWMSYHRVHGHAFESCDCCGECLKCEGKSWNFVHLKPNEGKCLFDFAQLAARVN